VAVFDGGVPSSRSGRGGDIIMLNGYSERAGGNIGSHTESEEDLLSVSTHNNHKNLEKNFEESHSNNIMDSFQYQNGTVDIASKEIVDRVRSVDSARLYSTPEKLVLAEPMFAGVSRVHVGGVPFEAPPTGNSWMGNFPRGSKLVTIPRGDKGFGFILVEKKVRGVE
jgi:hypothetical protein